MKGWILLTISVVMLVGWLSGCTKSSSSETLIEYRRSGGFSGLDDRLTIQEDGKSILIRKSEHSEFILDSDTVNHFRALFEEAKFSQLHKEYLPLRPGADLFEYVVTYNGHTVRTMDGAVPSSLQPILDALNQIVENRGNP